jgi:hypothetical protein
MKRLTIALALLLALTTSAFGQKKENVELTKELNSLRGCVDSLRAVCAQNNATMQLQMTTLNQQMTVMQQMMTVMQQLETSNKTLGEDYKSMKAEYTALQQSIKDLAAATGVKEYEMVNDHGDFYSYCGRTQVRQGVLFGYVDDTGKMVIPAIYERAFHFRYGFAKVKKNDKWGAIDTNGKVVIPFKYENDVYCSSWFKKSKAGVIAAVFMLDGKYCVIDCTGNIRVPLTSSRAECDGFFN